MSGYSNLGVTLHPPPTAVRSITARGSAQRATLTARAARCLSKEPHPRMGVPAAASRPALGCVSCGERLLQGSAGPCPRPGANREAFSVSLNCLSMS